MIGLTFARRILNITTIELGTQLNLTRQAISSWENKANNIPRNQYNNLNKIFKLPPELLAKEILDTDMIFILNYYSELLKSKEITFK